MTERTLQISTGDSIYDNSVKTIEFTWSDFVNKIKDFKVIDVTKEKYNSLEAREKHKLKDKGYFILGVFNNGKRNNNNIINREGLSLDFDDVSIEEMNKTIKVLEGSNLNFCLYSTASYDQTVGKFRVIIPFVEPIDPKDYKKVAENVVRELDFPKIDTASYTASQPFHTFTKLADVTPVFKARTNGVNLDANSYMNEVKQEDIIEHNNNQIEDTRAIEIMKNYVFHEGANLEEYGNYISAMMVIVKSVKLGQISRITGLELVKILANGNAQWESDNIKTYKKQLTKPIPNTKYDFFKKFDFTNWITSKRESISDRYEMANFIMSEIGLVKYGETMYFKDDNNHYISDDNILKRIAFSYAGNKSTSYVDEVIKQMEYRGKYISVDTQMKIAFRNGYLDNGRFIDKEYEEFTPYKIDINYDPSVKPVKVVDDYINHLTNNKPDYRKLLLEVLGHTLIVNPEFKRAVGKFFIFIGDGGNGKGTLLQIITRILGQKNVTALSIKELSDERYLNSFKGKLANLGDDLQDQAINDKDMKVLKNISTCDDLSVRKLHKNAETIKLTGSLIFTSNHAIKSFEKGKSYKRRVMWLPMFTKVESIDPYFISKLTTEESLSYWIKLFVEGYQRLYINKKFTTSKIVEDYNRHYHRDNNPAFMFLDEYDKSDFIDEPVVEKTRTYKDWCEINEFAYNKNFLLEALKEKFGIVSNEKTSRIHGTVTRVFSEKKE